MKALILTALLTVPTYGATNAEVIAQIAELEYTLNEQVADSTATALNSLVQGDAAYSTLKDAGVTVVNQAHQGSGKYDVMWVGLDFPLSSATSADSLKIKLAMGTLKAQHRAQDCGVSGRVRLRKDRLLEANETLKLIFD